MTIQEIRSSTTANPEMKITAITNTQSDFERFESLTNTLVSVPKAEVDEARKSEAEKKAR